MGWQNFYSDKLFTDIGATDTTITMSIPPSVTSGRLVIEPRNATQREIISYSGVSGSQLTGVVRGTGGTSARAHTKNSLVEMNVVAQDLTDALAVPNDIQTRFLESTSNFVASGLVVTATTGFSVSVSSGVAYLSGARISFSTSPLTFIANRDIYIDAQGNSTFITSTVTNGATAPALSAGRTRIAKVVTNASVVSSIQQWGVDNAATTGQVNYIYNTSPNAAPIFAYANAGSAGGTFYYRNQGGVKEFWGSTTSLVASGTAPQTLPYIINFPSSFFNVITSAQINAAPGTAANSAQIYIAPNAVVTTTSWLFYLSSQTGTNGTTSRADVSIRGF